MCFDDLLLRSSWPKISWYIWPRHRVSSLLGQKRMPNCVLGMRMGVYESATEDPHWKMESYCKWSPRYAFENTVRLGVNRPHIGFGLTTFRVSARCMRALLVSGGGSEPWGLHGMEVSLLDNCKMKRHQLTSALDRLFFFFSAAILPTPRLPSTAWS